MNACEACFSAKAWLAALDVPGVPGDCSFGHGRSGNTWTVSNWADYLYSLADIYVESVADGAVRLSERLQKDWQIFDLPTEQVERFLLAAAPDLDLGRTVTLEYEPHADHMTNWSGFVDEITKNNRFFPNMSIDRAALLAAVVPSELTISAGVRLFRARRCDSPVALPMTEMGAPPAPSARAGRANPVGIPYLYTSMDDSTSVHEARIANQEHCTIATLVVAEDLRVINLAEIEPPDPFSGDDLKQRLSSAAFLQELARELSVPTRPTDREVSYVPTQYFCEMLKSAGYAGVIYRSSINSGGKNVVLFDLESARVDGARAATVNSVTAAWSYVL